MVTLTRPDGKQFTAATIREPHIGEYYLCTVKQSILHCGRRLYTRKLVCVPVELTNQKGKSNEPPNQTV